MSKRQSIIWWKDKKLLVGFILVLLSAILGVYGKLVLIAKFYEPIGLITGLSIWVFSWLLLFLGIFLVGWETVKMIQYQIRHHIKKTAKLTYHHAKEMPKKGVKYTKELHRKSFDTITKKSKNIAAKLGIKND